MHWTHLVVLRLRPLPPDQSDTYLRALLMEKIPWESLQGWSMMTSSACLRKEASDSEQRKEVWGVKKRWKNGALKNATVVWDKTRYLVLCPNMLAATSLFVSSRFVLPTSRQSCEDQPKSKWHDCQRGISGAGNFIWKIQLFNDVPWCYALMRDAWLSMQFTLLACARGAIDSTPVKCDSSHIVAAVLK